MIDGAALATMHHLREVGMQIVALQEEHPGLTEAGLEEAAFQRGCGVAAAYARAATEATEAPVAEAV